jgi:4-amino-4-deoxy-L-arabinose transferase-like glycosyltransferase
MFSGKSGRWSLANVCLVSLPGLLLFCIGALTDITVPGVYMDAVNPDYAVVRVLNSASTIQTWFIPGVLLFGRWPILGQIYHGALPFYIGLPSYALFGTGVVGIRLTNMIFGCLVLFAAGAFIRAAGVRPLIASLCLALLALDPGFLFSFRIQFYITLLPIAAVFASAALVEARREGPSRTIVFLAGFLAGLACYGYFIFIFLVPALGLLALYRWRNVSRVILTWWALGLCVGVSPYLIGFCAVLVATGSPHAFLTFLRSDLQALHVGGSSLSVLQRVFFFYYLLKGTILDVGPSAMMLHAVTPLQIPFWKLVLLLLIPGVVALTGLKSPGRVVGLLFVVGLVAGNFGLVLVFGGRLWFQHAALLLPVLYAGLALSLERIASSFPAQSSRGVGIACALIVAPFLITNASDRQAVFLQLETTGGVGLASDAIDHFAQDALREKDSTHVFFPDWGAFMQFAMITRGTIPFTTGFSPAEASASCH